MHIVYGSTVSPLFNKEIYRNLETRNDPVTKKRRAVFAATNMPQMEIDTDIVAAASESYRLSPNISDYVIVPMPIVTADLPNRNLQFFSVPEITYFDPQYGMMVFQTFKGKCCFADHNNSSPPDAKGIIVDAALQFVPEYDVWKICIITLWDRTKDVKLVKDILSGSRDGYSMGSLVQNFVCSICGKIDPGDGSCCEHMQQKGKMFGSKKRIASQSCCGSCFFETSSVDVPADSTATSKDLLML